MKPFSHVAGILLWFSLLCCAPVFAEDPVTIGAIRADPESFHMQYVTLQGKLTEVQLSLIHI